MTSRDVTPVDGRHARVSTTMETTDKGEDKEDEGGRPRKPINKVMMVAKRTRRMRMAIKITRMTKEKKIER